MSIVSSRSLQRKLQARLEPFGQEHLLRFWSELNEFQRQQLAAQIEQLDLELVQSLFNSNHRSEDWSDLAARAETPSAITLDDFANRQSCQAALDAGREALAAGKVAMILVAGGQGSRLGFDKPKGMFPIGPLSNRTLYQHHFEHLLARAKQFNTRIPLFIMSSPATHQETLHFLSHHRNFGLPNDDVHIFCQGVMPAINLDGQLILEQKDRVFTNPDGHGGMLDALHRSGCLQTMMDRGIEHIFYGQVDNPLVQICHPALIGYHILRQSEMTSQVVRKHDPMQRVGIVVAVDGSVRIIEYSDLPEVDARRTSPDGTLKLWAGSIAVHIFETEFLRRCAANQNSLPFHRATKKVPYVNDQGILVQPAEPNAIKFERFIFDLLESANHPIVCEVDPADGFCAVKNAEGAASETPQHVQQALVDLHTRWLQQAGATIAPGIKIEINPLYAVDVETLQQKIKPGTRIEFPTYFSGDR